MNARKILVASLLAIGGASLATAIPVVTAVSASAQDMVMNISGTVFDQTGEPVIGATVMEKGTSNGTSTDIDGKFSLKVKRGATLVISYVGCETSEVKAEPDMTVTLKDASSLLDEVVVVGFGTQKKVNLTGAVSVATAKDIADRPVKNATEALQGIIPGLQLTRNAGDVETNMSINIRGIGTIGQGSSGSPLILIDGMEGDINTVNPSDIETVSVLKFVYRS